MVQYGPNIPSARVFRRSTAYRGHYIRHPSTLVIQSLSYSSLSFSQTYSGGEIFASARCLAHLSCDPETCCASPIQLLSTSTLPPLVTTILHTRIKNLFQQKLEYFVVMGSPWNGLKHRSISAYRMRVLTFWHSMSYNAFTASLICLLLDFTSTMKTSVLLSSIFFMALSVVNGNLTIRCLVILGACVSTTRRREMNKSRWAYSYTFWLSGIQKLYFMSGKYGKRVSCSTFDHYTWMSRQYHTSVADQEAWIRQYSYRTWAPGDDLRNQLCKGINRWHIMTIADSNSAAYTHRWIRIVGAPIHAIPITDLFLISEKRQAQIPRRGEIFRHTQVCNSRSTHTAQGTSHLYSTVTTQNIETASGEAKAHILCPIDWDKIKVKL